MCKFKVWQVPAVVAHHHNSALTSAPITQTTPGDLHHHRISKALSALYCWISAVHMCIHVIGIAQHKMILTAFALKHIAQADVSLAIYACMSLNDLTSGGAWNFQAYACHLNHFNSSPRSAISWDGHWQLHNIHSTDMPALGRQQIHAVRTESELTWIDKGVLSLVHNPQKRQTPISDIIDIHLGRTRCLVGDWDVHAHCAGLCLLSQ